MRRITFFSTLAVLLLLVPAASAQSSGTSTALDADYTLSWWTVDGGGATFAEGGGYTLGSTVGQPDAGILEGSPYTLVGGFWNGAVARIRIYLALAMRDFRNKDWEMEPNDTSAQAGGPLASNETYYGAMPVGDTNDYFYLDLPTSGDVELWLTNIPSGCDYDLVLRDATLSQVGYSGNVGSVNEHVTTGTLSAGRYYIQVYHRSAAGSSEPYHLRAVYP